MRFFGNQPIISIAFGDERNDQHSVFTLNNRKNMEIIYMVFMKFRTVQIACRSVTELAIELFGRPVIINSRSQSGRDGVQGLGNLEPSYRLFICNSSHSQIFLVFFKHFCILNHHINLTRELIKR